MDNSKQFWKSKTFWGLVAMTIGIWAPRYATALQGSVDDVMNLVGLVLTLWGRWKATQPLSLTSSNPNPPAK